MSLEFASLDAAEQELSNASRQMATAGRGKLFPLDLLAWAAANRATGLSAAFRLLVEGRNYLTAAALLRLQLDTALRLMAAWQVADPHEFAKQVLAGKHVRKCQDRHGQPLTDSRLVEIASSEAPWVRSVYAATSGFVHLSERHIFGAVAEAPQGRQFSMKISAVDPGHLTDATRQEAIEGFAAATRLLAHYLAGWAATKDRSEDSERGA